MCFIFKSKKKWVCILTLIFVLALTFSFFDYIDEVKADAFNGHYYGYGDSIMRTTGHCGNDVSDNFVIYMQSTFDAGNTSSRNDDGGGDTSNMGVDEFASHVTNMGWCVIEQFGVNDLFYADENDGNGEPCSATILAQNKMQMYNYSVENNSEDHYYPCLFTLADDDYGGEGHGTQLLFINTSKTMMDKFGVRYIPLYDAIDTIPLNGRVDEWDTNYYCDNVHPTANGHSEMGNLSWYFIQGWDYNQTYYNSNDTLIVKVDYNETINIVNSDISFNIDSLIITCLNNDTSIDFSVVTAVNGSEMIQFDGVKGCEYKFKDNALYFTDICGLQNNSSLNSIGRNRWGNSSAPTIYDIDDANAETILNITYQVRVANDSGFTDVFINETSLNQWFNLTDTINFFGYHYYDYKARVRVRTGD